MSKQLTANQKLEAWLDSEEKDYIAGLALFLEYSRNRSLHAYLLRKQDAAKLEYEIRKLSGYNNLKSAGEIKQILLEKNANKQVEFTERVKITEDGKIRFEDLPEILQGYYTQNTNEYKTMRSLHEKMKQATTDKERAGIYKGLVNLDDRILKRWKAIDHWATTEELPQGKEAAPQIITDLTPQEVTKHRTAVNRSLTSLEHPETTEKKREESLHKLQEASTALLQGKQVFKEETIARIKVFIPEFGEK